MATDKKATWQDELALIEAVLNGYPDSMAKADALRAVRVLQANPPAAQPAPTVQEPVWWPRPEDQPIDNGPDHEDGPDEEGFSGPRPWNSYAQPAPEKGNTP
jgi:hypothetical protein